MSAMAGSEFLVTGGIQVQAETLPSEDAKEGFSFIRGYYTGLKSMLNIFPVFYKSMVLVCF